MIILIKDDKIFLDEGEGCPMVEISPEELDALCEYVCESLYTPFELDGSVTLH